MAGRGFDPLPPRHPNLYAQRVRLNPPPDENRKASERQLRGFCVRQVEGTGELPKHTRGVYTLNIGTSTSSSAKYAVVPVAPEFQHLNRPQRLQIVRAERARGLKRCPGCYELRSLALYSRTQVRGLNGVASRCLPCSVSSRYDISAQGYLDLLEAQNASCAVCSRKPELPCTLHVDHCHQTGKVRGLLCRPCNLGMGYFRDNTANLKSAVAYLERAA